MADLIIRWGALDDAREVAIVHVASWRHGYAGLMDQQVLDALSVDERTDGWVRWITASAQPHRLLVAEIEGVVAGWATFGPGRDDGMHQNGELAGLYVHPDHWSTGVGSALIRRAERELRSAGFIDAYLWALRGNDRAFSFYERRGWTADGGEKVAEMAGATLHERRFSRRLEG